MYRVTIRPIGTVNTKPTIVLLRTLWEYGAFSWHLHTALKETYGKNILKDNGTDLIAYNDEFGEICRIELDKLDPEEFPDKAIPNV